MRSLKCTLSPPQTIRVFFVFARSDFSLNSSCKCRSSASVMNVKKPDLPDLAGDAKSGNPVPKCLIRQMGIMHALGLLLTLMS